MPSLMYNITCCMSAKLEGIHKYRFLLVSYFKSLPVLIVGLTGDV